MRVLECFLARNWKILVAAYYTYCMTASADVGVIPLAVLVFIVNCSVGSKHRTSHVSVSC